MRLVAAMLLILPAAAAPTLAAKPVQSWGKADISFDRYRLDAAECSIRGGTADIAAERETLRYVQGERVLDRDTNQRMAGPDEGDQFRIAERQVLLRRMYAPHRQVDALQHKMSDRVETCLIERGYTRFTLTRAQVRVLARMKLGSPERRRYLHGLASDPAVLSVQAS